MVSLLCTLKKSKSILGLGVKDDFETIVKYKMEKAMDNYNNSTTGNAKKIWDLVQKDVKCCGVEKYTDWIPVMEVHKVPDSCCKVETKGCGKVGFFDTEKIYKEGCLAKIIDNSGILATLSRSWN
jgi:hypothetical protein